MKAVTSVIRTAAMAVGSRGGPLQKPPTPAVQAHSSLFAGAKSGPASVYPKPAQCQGTQHSEPRRRYELTTEERRRERERERGREKDKDKGKDKKEAEEGEVLKDEE